MKDLGVDIVSVSLDGATAEMHDRIREIPGTWQATLDAISTATSWSNLRQLADIFVLSRERGAVAWELSLSVLQNESGAPWIDSPRAGGGLPSFGTTLYARNRRQALHQPSHGGITRDPHLCETGHPAKKRVGSMLFLRRRPARISFTLRSKREAISAPP